VNKQLIYCYCFWIVSG